MNVYLSYKNEIKSHFLSSWPTCFILYLIKKSLSITYNNANNFSHTRTTLNVAVTTDFLATMLEANTVNYIEKINTRTIQSYHMKKVNLILALISLLAVSLAFGQQDKVIDASKPTNFYNSINHALEYTSRPDGGNLLGYRANLVLAPSEKNLILGEIPVLYNTESKKFGLGDIRGRYFYLPYKNYSKFFGAFGPSIDIIAPTGNSANGIGTGRWTIAPGIAMGLIFSESIQVFPILSYQYISKPVNTDNSTGENDINGGSLQFVTVIVASHKTFFQITPTFSQSYQNAVGSFTYIMEISFGYQMGAKSVLGAYCKRAFENDLTQISVGLTKYF